MINTRAGQDARKVLTGKDGALYNAEGVLLATVDTFQAQVSINNAKYNPLGHAQEHEVFASYSVTLNFTEVIIEDNQFTIDLVAAMQTGTMPEWNFQGVIKGRNGSEQRVVYRGCTPSGSVDLQNLSQGDTLKRSWSMFVNDPPELQSILTA